MGLPVTVRLFGALPLVLAHRRHQFRRRRVRLGNRGDESLEIPFRQLDALETLKYSLGFFRQSRLRKVGNRLSQERGSFFSALLDPGIDAATETCRGFGFLVICDRHRLRSSLPLVDMALCHTNQGSVNTIITPAI